MNIHEYQAKEILRKYGVPVRPGIAITRHEDIDYAIDSLTADMFVVKAQIHAGGRGKAGGVKLSKSRDEAKTLAKNMWGLNLVTPQTGPQGQKVQRLYIESGVQIKKELYLGAVLDRASECITFMVSAEGGVNIEEVASTHPEKVIKVKVNPLLGVQPFHIRKIVFFLNLDNNLSKQLSKLISATYNALIGSDATQVEINPLVITDDDQLIALDAKMNFDDNALFRQQSILAMRDETEEDPLELRAANAELSYVRMDGNIGCMVNGAGLAMATADIIQLYGAAPANFLDVGGSADRERVAEALRIILKDPNVQGILINIFGGIMRCDIIAEGVLDAAQNINLSVPLVVRLSGTNFELGKQILRNSKLDITVADDLADAAKKIVQAVK